MENTKTKKKESQYSLDTKLKSPLFKIVLVGDSDVGKTSIIQTFINNSFPKQRSKKSVGINFTLKELKLKNLNVRLEIWDTAGNEKLRTMIGSYYRGAHGIILVFDFNNVKSFYAVKNWLREIKQFASEDTIKYLVCNKYDLRNSTIQFNKNLAGDLNLFEGLSETNKTFNTQSLIFPSNLNTMNNTNNQTLNNIILTNPNQTTNNINNFNLNLNNGNNNNNNNNNLNSIVISSKNSIVPLTNDEIEKFAKQNSMKFYKISASLNQGINELFEDITRDIIHKMNDEDLINRSRSIKLGYNNSALYNADEEQQVKDWNYCNSNEKTGFLRNRSGNYQDKQVKDFNNNDNNWDNNNRKNKSDYSLGNEKDKKNNLGNGNNNKYFNSNFSGCCKII